MTARNWLVARLADLRMGRMLGDAIVGALAWIGVWIGGVVVLTVVARFTWALVRAVWTAW